MHPGVVPDQPAGDAGAPLPLPLQAVGAGGAGLDGKWLGYFSTSELYRQVRCLDEYLSGKSDIWMSICLISQILEEYHLVSQMADRYLSGKLDAWMSIWYFSG